MTQGYLDALRSQLPAAQLEAVLAAVDPKTISTIEAAGRTEWLPAELQLDIDGATYQVLGEDGLRSFNRNYAANSAEIPMFAPIARGVLALFGGAEGALKILPRTWSFIARNCGSCSYETVEKGHGRVRYEGLPVSLRKPSFIATSEGSVLGILDFSKADGARAVHDPTIRIEDGVVQIDAYWLA